MSILARKLTGLKGYEQLQAIAWALCGVPPEEPGTGYLQRLAMQVERALEKNRTLAQDVQEAHAWLRRIAACLRYPPSSFSTSDASETPLTGEQIKQEMEDLLQQLRQVPLTEYQARRLRLAETEVPRQFLCRLHHDPLATVRRLVEHAARRVELVSSTGLSPP